jgi:hypothetical protein
MEKIVERNKLTIRKSMLLTIVEMNKLTIRKLMLLRMEIKQIIIILMLRIITRTYHHTHHSIKNIIISNQADPFIINIIRVIVILL